MSKKRDPERGSTRHLTKRRKLARKDLVRSEKVHRETNPDTSLKLRGRKSHYYWTLTGNAGGKPVTYRIKVEGEKGGQNWGE